MAQFQPAMLRHPAAPFGHHTAQAWPAPPQSAIVVAPGVAPSPFGAATPSPYGVGYGYAGGRAPAVAPPLFHSAQVAAPAPMVQQLSWTPAPLPVGAWSPAAPASPRGPGARPPEAHRPSPAPVLWQPSTFLTPRVPLSRAAADAAPSSAEEEETEADVRHPADIGGLSVDGVAAQQEWPETLLDGEDAGAEAPVSTPNLASAEGVTTLEDDERGGRRRPSEFGQLDVIPESRAQKEDAPQAGRDSPFSTPVAALESAESCDAPRREAPARKSEEDEEDDEDEEAELPEGELPQDAAEQRLREFMYAAAAQDSERSLPAAEAPAGLAESFRSTQTAQSQPPEDVPHPTQSHPYIADDVPEEAPPDPSDPAARLDLLLASDGRLTGDGLGYLCAFFAQLGIASVSDLLDIEALEPLPNYFREALEGYEATQGRATAVQRAALGRLIRSVGRAPEQRHLDAEDSFERAARGAEPPQQPRHQLLEQSPAQTPRMLPQLHATQGNFEKLPSPSSRSSPRGSRRGGYSPRGDASPWRGGSTSKRGSFSQAGAGHRGGRKTILCEARGDCSPGPTIYRPTMASWDNRRPASPRVTIGTAKREALFVRATDTPGPGCVNTGTIDRQVRGAVMGSASRFAYGSVNRPTWLR